jgi:GDP-L-fucose synthase
MTSYESQVMNQGAMPFDARIYVAGHRGLVGSALMRRLQAEGYQNLITRTHKELDLTDQAATRAFFEHEKPEYVFLAAAKAGGIYANNTYPAEFIHENLAIQTNVIHEAWRAGIKRLLFLGSSCIYPRDCPQPIKEEYLLTGPLEPTNRAYAIAKIAGIEMCWAYNRQHGTQYLAAMPTNLYGPGDNYDLQTSHVLPALIRKFHEAKMRQTDSRLTTNGSRDDSVVVWGTGKPCREFLYSDDAADACVFLMNLPDQAFDSVLSPESSVQGDYSSPPLINIGCGQDQTIKELADTVRTVVDYEGDVAWDSSKPDGTPRKLLDVSRLAEFGWKPTIGLKEGIGKAYEDYLSRLTTEGIGT